LVHRDRDSLTDEEVVKLCTNYETQGAGLWLPTESDIEAYFCNSDFLEVFLGCTQEDAIKNVSDILVQHSVPIREQFNSQRAAHNKELYAEGGSPTNDDVWDGLQHRPLRGAKGKFVFKQLKNKIPAGTFNSENILKSSLGGQVALDLKHKIEQILVE